MPSRADTVERLFHAALELAPERRGAFLQRETAGDATLIAQVERLLEVDAGAAPVDETSALARVAHQLLHDPGHSIGRTVGPYRIVALIGTGGMGVVYRAEREDVGATVALKLLPDTLSAAMSERFLEERRTLARLRHSGIAQLFDAGVTDDNTPWFAMELVDGRPIHEYCAMTGAGLRERLRLFREVGESVHHAHQQLVVHRDLKPSNVLVTSGGNVKLIDFGVATALTPDGGRDDALTPAYAAPEQLEGQAASVQSDLYSLGVLLYQLLTGALPWATGDLAARGNVPAPSARLSLAADGLDVVDLDRICLRLLATDPAARPRSADALLRDLERLGQELPLDHAAGWRYRLRKFVRRRGRAAAVVALAVGVAGVGAVSYTRGLSQARRAAEAEASRARRIQRTLVGLLQGDDDAVGPADSLRVVTLVDRGIEQAAAVTNDAPLQAELRETLGTVLMQLGRYERADSLLAQSLDQRRAALGPDHPDVGAGLLALGRLRGEQARYAEAESTVHSAIALLGRTAGTDTRRVADGYEVLAEVLELGGKYREAIAALQTAIASGESRADTTEELAPRWYSLANNYYYAGVHDTAELLNRRVLAVWRRTLGEAHPRVADAIINLGAIAQDRGRLADAESLYTEGAAIIERWYGADHPRTAGAVSMLGRAALLQQHTGQADSLLRRALTIRRRALGDGHPRVGLLYNELANIAFGRQELVAAESLFSAAIAVYQRAYRGPHQYTGTAQSGLASVYLARKEPARAEQLARAAIATFLATLSADHLNVGVARLKLGRALYRQGRAREAEMESLRAHDLLSQKEGATSFVNAVRADLVEIYSALGRPGDAARFRAPPDSGAPR
jgi:serine/threonine-protein kinase